MRKAWKILLNAIPVALMVALIPHVKDDYVLMLYFVGIITVAFLFKREEGEVPFFIFGFVVMTISEYFFIKTGVETFNRRSLGGIMPMWLPFLWAYGFVAIKRAGEIL